LGFTYPWMVGLCDFSVKGIVVSQAKVKCAVELRVDS